MKIKDVCVLTYDFPHKRTQDLLFKLKTKDYNVKVFGTPWKERKNFKPLIPHRFFEADEILPSELCNKFGFKYSRVESVQEIQTDDYILIGGAGIIPEKITKTKKIINSHPAYLPYVRGLDSLKWAIYYNKPIGVTTHIISGETDTGWLIKKKLVPIYPWDTFHSIAYRQYELEIKMLANSVHDLETAKLEPLSNKESIPHRRMPNELELKLLDKLTKIISKKNNNQ